MSDAQVTLGPVLFNWAPQLWRDFYFRIADEAPISTVNVGEVVCSKRAPLFEPYVEEVVARLIAGGKSVVHSTLAQVTQKIDTRLVESIAGLAGAIVEANDACALRALRGRPHHVGPYINTYNEDTLAFLAGRGAQNVCLPPELPIGAIEMMGQAGARLATSIEVQVFGRQPLALSARCYHARAHGRTKDSCLFVCEQDADGLRLDTLDSVPFLAINGIQTLSYGYLSLAREVPRLRVAGVTRFRLSPHSCDMVEVANVFRALLDETLDPGTAQAQLEALGLAAPFANGFFYRRPGHQLIGAEQVRS